MLPHLDGRTQCVRLRQRCAILLKCHIVVLSALCCLQLSSVKHSSVTISVKTSVLRPILRITFYNSGSNHFVSIDLMQHLSMFITSRTAAIIKMGQNG